jgi:hypothetical protein
MITLDIDTKDRSKMLSTYYKASKYGETTVAETGHGFHYRIQSDIEDPWEILRIRQLLGDDPKRIERDKIVIQLGCPEIANRLFERKKVKGKYTVEKPINPLKWGENE